ncbi:MAG: class I SAM-dependent methyltransferase [Deltaproteobacteria bacterium]|nr:class I SAM-dependent methyltransferase [Deltaproteobacteria bacterium]
MAWRKSGSQDPGPSRYDPRDLEAGTREHYVDASLYDFEYRRRRADVNHYRRLARSWNTGGGILELGCGTGRLLVPLARDGHRVVGVDMSHEMLVAAQNRLGHLGRNVWERARLLQADMRATPLGKRFPLVICAFNTFQHLYSSEDVASCLACVREHLEEGGRFAFDVLVPDLHWLVRDPLKRWARTVFHHPKTGERLEYSTNHVYDPITQIVHVRIYYRPVPEKDEPASPDSLAASRKTRVVRLAHRQFFPAELEELLSCHGFVVEERWGSFSGEKLDGNSDSMVLLCKSSVEKP